MDDSRLVVTVVGSNEVVEVEVETGASVLVRLRLDVDGGDGVGGAGVEIAPLEGISRVDRIGETGFTVLVGQRIPGFWLDTVDESEFEIPPSDAADPS